VDGEGGDGWGGGGGDGEGGASVGVDRLRVDCAALGGVVGRAAGWR
jgi:hypothetical protein